MLEGRTEEEEWRQWEEIDKKVRFYDKEEETISEDWDAREATKAIKDDEMD